MCEKCNSLKEHFEAAKRNPNESYLSTMQFIKEMQMQGIVELYAGDCPLDEVERILYDEMHYTVHHYFKCNSCNQYFFIGACIRGKPIYKTLNDLSDVNFNILWGQMGTMFEKKKV